MIRGIKRFFKHDRNKYDGKVWNPQHSWSVSVSWQSDSFIIQPKTTVAGIYGAGGEYASDNPTLKKMVESQGGKMFTSSWSGGDDEIIDYLKEAFLRGNQLKIYGHSRGGAAAVRIANKLGEMHIDISEMTLFDPVGMYLGGDFVFTYPNVMKVTNYYQRNSVDGVLIWADNPFQGSPVNGNFQWPEINNKFNREIL